MIADLCIEHDAVAITDEIYEHILYDGRQHVSIGYAAGHGGPDRHDQQLLQDLQRDGLAGRVRPGGRVPHGRIRKSTIS